MRCTCWCACRDAWDYVRYLLFPGWGSVIDHCPVLVCFRSFNAGQLPSSMKPKEDEIRLRSKPIFAEGMPMVDLSANNESSSSLPSPLTLPAPPPSASAFRCEIMIIITKAHRKNELSLFCCVLVCCWKWQNDFLPIHGLFIKSTECRRWIPRHFLCVSFPFLFVEELSRVGGGVVRDWSGICLCSVV